jgi:hypothetical protein
LNDVADPTLTNDSVVLFRKHSAATVLVEDAVFRRRWDAMMPLERNRLLRTNPHVARSLSVDRDLSSPD